MPSSTIRRGSAARETISGIALDGLDVSSTPGQIGRSDRRIEVGLTRTQLLRQPRQGYGSWREEGEKDVIFGHQELDFGTPSNDTLGAAGSEDDR